MEVRHREDRDLPEVEPFLAERHSRQVARVGRLEDTLSHPALIAERDGQLAGVLTYVVDRDACEVLTLHAAEPRAGVGNALRFYQRRGFRLAALLPGAVDHSHSRSHLKPEVPAVGEYGIHLRDELELDKVLDP